MATKVPPQNAIWPAPAGQDPAETFPGSHIRASLETSLRKSGLEAFDEGGLTGKITAGSTFPAGDFRGGYFRDDRPAEVERRVDALVADLGIDHDQVAEFALRYVLDHPAVATVIPGMRTVANVERNAAISDGMPLSAKQLDVLAGHRWERNFYR